MKKLITLLSISILILFSGCSRHSLVSKVQCLEKPQANFMYVDNNGKGECLSYEKFYGNDKNNDKVIVFLHSSMRTASHPIRMYYHPVQKISSRTGITAYLLSLPGYTGSSANNWNKMYQSSRQYNAAEPQFIKFIVSLLKQIKTKENANELIVIGHSAGATLGATISGHTPKLINKVIVYEGNYDVGYYHRLWGYPDGRYLHRSAINYIDSIDQSTSFQIMYGLRSDKKKPIESERFVKMLKDRNIKVKESIYPGFGHSMFENEIYEDIISFIKMD